MKKKNLSVASKLYMMVFGLCSLMALIAGVVYFVLTSSIGRRDLDTTITDIAAYVADLSDVRTYIKENRFDKNLIEMMDGISGLSQLDVLVICDSTSVRHYHTIHDRVGDAFIGGDEGPILEGADPYISVAEGTLGLQRRAFHAIHDDDGTIIGFVMASVLDSRLDSIRARNLRAFLLIFVAILLLGGILAQLFLRSLFKALLGHDPERIAELYVERGELLQAMEQQMDLTRELSGANAMIGTLRTINHEFKNKLHVILGLLETGETARAKDYILEASALSSQAVDDIRNRIPEAGVAALLIGKMMRAQELGITFILKQDTNYSIDKKGPAPEAIVTILGNLIENAIEELNSGDFEEKRIEAGIYTGTGHTMILCDDTGGGIPEEILIKIYDNQTSTKGKGHGNGLHTIREIVDLYEGTIHIDTEQGEGTSFQIDLPL